MIPANKHARVDHRAYNSVDRFVPVQRPPKIRSTASLSSHHNQWTDVHSQLDCFNHYHDDAIHQTAFTNPGRFMSFSPLRGSRRKTSSSYPSQQLRRPSPPPVKGFGSFTVPSLQEEGDDDDHKLPPIAPVPPLPPPLPVPSYHHFNVDDAAAQPSNVGHARSNPTSALTDAAIKLEADEQTLDTLNYAYPSPPVAERETNTNDIEDTSMLDDFEFDHNDILTDMNADPSFSVNEFYPVINDHDHENAFTAEPTKKTEKSGKRRVKSSKFRKPKKSSASKVSSGGIENPGVKDVLRGRGGLTNRHAGNIWFRDEARKLRATYRNSATSRRDKYFLSKELVKTVLDQGGRFLERGHDNLWYEMDDNARRKKASQVLREEKWD